MKRRGFISSIVGGLAAMATPFLANSTPVDGVSYARIINAMSPNNMALIDGASYGLHISDNKEETSHLISVWEKLDFKDGTSIINIYRVPHDYPNQERSGDFIARFMQDKVNSWKEQEEYSDFYKERVLLAKREMKHQGVTIKIT